MALGRMARRSADRRRNPVRGRRQQWDQLVRIAASLWVVF
jgi:hypothetical protein